MFNKKTYLDKSSIQGIGLFSGEDIAKGELVYKHSPRLQHILKPKELDSLQKNEKDTFTHYGYFWKGKWYLDFDDYNGLGKLDNCFESEVVKYHHEKTIFSGLQSQSCS